MKRAPALVIDSPGSAPSDPLPFYEQLTTRNRHFISARGQERMRKLRVLVAGCGSGGGACIEPLVRLGITQLRLADNGAYELSNLNRQHAFVDALGVNKAVFHKREALRINPHLDVEAFPKGITPRNVALLTAWADLIVDGVDVTTQAGIAMKIALHEQAARRRKPCLSPLDLGFRQWGRVFDYRQPKIRPFFGKGEAARAETHPIKAMFQMFPVSCVPDHCLTLIDDLLKDVRAPASQLGAAADVLSGVIAAVVTRYCESGELPKGWDVDLTALAYSEPERKKQARAAPAIKRRIRANLKG